MLKLTLSALNSRIARVADRTCAGRGMHSRLADGVRATRLDIAGIATGAQNTLLRVQAVKVDSTEWHRSD